MGRLFDAVASLIGIRHVSAYEAQAAIELEARARGFGREFDERGYEFEIVEREGLIELEPAPVLRAIVADLQAGVPEPVIAAGFHDAVARMVLTGLQRMNVRRPVALSGGVFQNLMLLSRTVELLEDAGYRVLTHRQVPPNDGGLSLGQAVAAAVARR
jgi:hydrogenase maturation protein HypF